MNGQGPTAQASAGAAGRDGHLAFVAEAHDLADFLGGARPQHGVGREVQVLGVVVAVGVVHGGLGPLGREHVGRPHDGFELDEQGGRERLVSHGGK